MREPGWTGKSWLFTGILGESTTRSLASILFVLAAIALVIGRFGIFFRTEWWWTPLIGSAIFSSAIILILWNGGMELLVDKGLIGFLISLVILLVLFVLKRPAFAF